MQRVHSRPSAGLARAILLMLAIASAVEVAEAELRDSPPKGVTLAGTWHFDAARSDDAQAVVDRARDDLISRSGSARAAGRLGGFPGSANRGGFGGGKGGSGGWDRSDDSDVTTDVRTGPLGTDGSQEEGPSAAAAGRGDLLADLAKNPDTLVFAAQGHSVKVTAGETEIECEAGEKVTVGDRLGDAERQCGWDGRAWVIQTQRSGGGTRIDRYELSRDGKSVRYTTVVSGGRLSKIKLSRIYQAAPPAATAGP